MEKFKELVLLCKASVEISVNSHKDYYETVEQHIKEKERENIGKEVFEEMVKRDIVVRVQAYPDTPIGFFVVYHYDIDKAVASALMSCSAKTNNPTRNMLTQFAGKLRQWQKQWDLFEKQEIIKKPKHLDEFIDEFCLLHGKI